MPGKPHQSRLIPYEQEIVALRHRRPPTPYARIAELLMEKYNLAIQAPAIFKFVKTRSKGRKVFSYARNIQSTKTPLFSKTTASQTAKPSVSEKQRTPVASERVDIFNMPFSETYNLHRLPPEEAEARLKKIEEAERLRDKASSLD